MAEHDVVTVFGGAGYIGCWLVEHLLREGYHVRVFDNFLFGRAGLDEILRRNPDQLDHVEVIDGDICDTRAVSGVTEGSYAVCMLAALIGHRVRDGAWTDTRNTNLLATSVVLDAAIEHGVERFLFASTNSVYGIKAGVMYETTIPEPVSLYARLKLRMEERIIKSKRSGFHPAALRIATCHGYSPRMRFDLVANALIRDAVTKKMILIESGEQWRAQIHVEDVARAFVLCLKAHANLVSGEVFNVGSANLQVNQLANMVKSAVPDALIDIVEGDPDLIDYRLSCSKIEKVLDFSPRWTLEQSLAQLRDLLAENHFGDPWAMQYYDT